MQEQIWEAVSRHDTVILHRHVRPDPDAVGSQAGLAELIKTSFPQKKLYLAGESEASLEFLSGMDTFDDAVYEGALVIVCDTANTARIDGAGWDKGKMLIKIDHHPDVEPYGDIQWVDTEASSTSEMIAELAENVGADMHDEAARLLYAGITADTGRFRFPNTTSRTFHAAQKLAAFTFDRSSLYHEMEKTSLTLLRLQGYVLSSVELTKNGAARVNLSEETLASFDVTSNDAAAIVNCFSHLDGLRAWVFFVEEPERIRVRMRSKGPEINALAQKYRGGGHPMASGADALNWEEADALFQELDELCGHFPK
ncbi:DHH family phosphoesterase [Alkalicoccus urumqiensis]|uniref:DHH family phosphoesterase n=1 Tax=Alkalicoccus urumqiensis TaxID=1548213 RepID=A0A2P6MDG7_ALKUR|nr:bifunctional oligoribonuclease/PAP phosphatase NrnA [Alkalicoccus urumqiensis]PRO64331.1 DHH family phosphoesterase [Alkalicoccus urumqiensis]